MMYFFIPILWEKIIASFGNAVFPPVGDVLCFSSPVFTPEPTVRGRRQGFNIRVIPDPVFLIRQERSIKRVSAV